MTQALVSVESMAGFYLPAVSAETGRWVGVSVPLHCLNFSYFVDPEAMPSLRISVTHSFQHFARSKSPVSHIFGHLGDYSYTLSQSHGRIHAFFVAYNSFPVLALTSPSVERVDLLHASAINLVIQNENFSGTKFANLEPLFGVTEMPLPNSVRFTINTDNMTVFKGNSSCPDSDR